MMHLWGACTMSYYEELFICQWTVAEVVDYLLKGNEDICFSDYVENPGVIRAWVFQ